MGKGLLSARPGFYRHGEVGYWRAHVYLNESERVFTQGDRSMSVHLPTLSSCHLAKEMISVCLRGFFFPTMLTLFQKQTPQCPAF